jgi:fibronectin-binding autotransporter adhesin
VAGIGTFTPKVGAAYQRAWVTQVGFGGTWTNSLSGTLDGTWGRGKQWSTGTPAMQVGDAAFSANANYTVSLDRNESTRTISVTAGTVVLNTNGHNLESTATTSIGSGAMLAVDDSAGGNVSVGALAGEGRLHVRSQMLTVGGSGASTTFSGRIEGAGSLTKTGTGTQTLSGANEYTGITSVTGGTLLVNNTTGSGTGYGNVDVVGGTLGGTGSIAGAVTIGSGGTLAPGASIETLNVGALTFNSGSTFSYEMNTNLSLTVAADLVNASGDLTFAATDVALAITDAGSTLLAGAKFTLIAYSGNWNGGTFAGHPNNSLITVGLNQYALKYNDTTMGQNFATESLAGAGVHYVTLTAVPEARAFVMLGLVGVVASAFVWLKQRRLAAQSD